MQYQNKCKFTSLQVYSGNFRFTIIVNNKKLYIHTNIQMKQGYDGLICLYNYIYDIFVCGFTYTLLHVTVNYICPMIFTKLFLFFFFHGGSDALFVLIPFFALLMLLSTNMNLAKHTEKQFFLVLNYV